MKTVCGSELRCATLASLLLLATGMWGGLLISTAGAQATNGDQPLTVSQQSDSTSDEVAPASPTPDSSDADQASADANASDPTTAADAEGADGTAGGATTSTTDGGGEINFTLLAIVLALFIVPTIIGNWLAKRLRMEDHGWKISLAIGTLAAAGVVFGLGEVKFGPDLSGGVILIYELQDTSAVVVESDRAAGDDGAADGEEADTTADGRQRVEMNSLIDALSRRVDPSGTKEVTIRQYGASQVEIIIPRAAPDELEYLKRKIKSAGALEFRITADPRWGDEDKEIIRLAKLNDDRTTSVVRNGKKIAEWVQYDAREFPPNDDRIVTRTGAGGIPQALIRTDDNMDVDGGYLTAATQGVDETGNPAVNFRFNRRGGNRFGILTGSNRPSASGAFRYLGIVLDKRLISAPRINSKITDSGQISGGGMTREEVDFIISILNAGSLPAALNDEPISEETISPTLGVATIESGRRAIAGSLAAVLVFMLLYYRFAGVVASLALLANLLLILGVMVLFRAAFTLPGLAGLVLTVGMSVDANVLIFERIREERRRGAALRMAIRNGFARATTTIVDANLTTLITAVALYAIGTDQIKGFGVTLTLGILMSMYTAIFCSRIIFDIAERQRWITELKMSSFLGETSIDFLSKRGVAAVASLLIISAGLAAVFARGSGLLNIDFTGGTSVTCVFEDQYKTKVADVREALLETDLADQNLSVVGRGEVDESGSGTTFTVNTSNADVNHVQTVLADRFSGRLKSYLVEIDDLNAVDTNAGAGGDGAQTPTQSTEASLSFNDGPGHENDYGIHYEALEQRLKDAIAAVSEGDAAYSITNPDYQPGSAIRLKNWTVRLDLGNDAATDVLRRLQGDMNSQPMFPLSNKIGERVAGDMQVKAIYAMLVCLVGIVGYIWLRFQQVMFGLAAVAALIHDVLVTLGMIALSQFVVNYVPALAVPLQIESFQISLPIVAAFLTIIGYSLNDTIVVFDRIREVRGKSPKLTAGIINKSINQTLGRTLLTSMTTLMVVLILYFFGGAGIHGFAFSLVIGVVVGTYSSIFVASPLLLAMSGSSEETAGQTANSSGNAA